MANPSSRKANRCSAGRFRYPVFNMSIKPSPDPCITSSSRRSSRSFFWPTSWQSRHASNSSPPIPSGSSVAHCPCSHNANRASLASPSPFASVSPETFTIACCTSRKVTKPSKASCSPSRGNERSGEISAHFPIDTNRLAGSGPAHEFFERGVGQITCPLCVFIATS